MGFTSANETFPETEWGSNNSLQTASELIIGNTVNGAIDRDDSIDFYKVNLSSKRTYTVDISAQFYRVTVKLFDANGNELWEEDPYWNDVSHLITFSKELKMETSVYYLAIERYDNHTGNYSLSVSEKPLVKAEVYSVKSSKGGLQLSWYAVQDASGYEVKYSTKKSMKSDVTTTTVNSTSLRLKNLLRKKKYYFKIRAFANDGDKVSYGNWSSKIVCKTK